MTWVRLPGAKSSKQLSHTSELELDYRKWLARKCKHPEFVVKRVIWDDGRPAYRKYCDTCGLPQGSWIAQKNLGELSQIPDGDAQQHSAYEDQRISEWKEIALRHYRHQNSEDRLAYDQYLKSPEWRAKSLKVINRAGGICEGCLERKATQAHHVSYRHIFAEFLWELRAVCEPCHHRAHADGKRHLFGDDGSIFELPDDEAYENENGVTF